MSQAAVMAGFKNIYRAGVPWELAKPGSKRLLLRPVLSSDFIPPNQGLQMVQNTSDKEAREKALNAGLFEVMAVSPDVSLPIQPEVGDFVIMGIAGVESVDSRGKRLACHELDVAMIFKRADMLVGNN